MSARDGGAILIVRHGLVRGRGKGHVWRTLAYFEKERPRLHASLRHCRTGDESPSLSGVAAVVFWLSDPLREQFPECFQHAMEIARAARARGLPLVNPPDALSNTIKTRQARLWQEAGIPTPPHRGASSRDALVPAAGEVGFPLIVRSDRVHGQRKMRVFRSTRALRSAPARKFEYPASVTPIADTRAGYRTRRPGTVWARYFHKKRAFVFGRHVVFHELLFSRHPIVGRGTCNFDEPEGWRSLPDRLSGAYARRRACVAEDLEYWRRGDAHADLLCRANAALGLDWSAIDYSETADGEAILWEANPAFHLPVPGEMFLPAERRTEERERDVLAAAADFLESLRHSSGELPEHRARAAAASGPASEASRPGRGA